MSVSKERTLRLWHKLPDTPSGALINSFIRILLAPLFISLELVSLWQRLVEDEYLNSRSDALLLSPEGSSLAPIAPKIFINRFRECWRVSAPLFLEGVFYIVCLEIVAALGLQHVFRHYRDEIEHFVALVTGQWYVTAKGDRFPTSPSSGDVLHVLSDPHCLDGHSPRCPLRTCTLNESTDCPCRASFMIACCKLVYEPEPVVWDALHRWELAPVSYRNIPANMHLGSAYVPDLLWFAASTTRGLVLSFAGAQVWLKVDRMTDISCAMTSCLGAGRMLKGFVTVFDKIDPLTGVTVFETLATILEKRGAGKQVYLTGHSLGGGIALTFAMLLATRKPELAEKIVSITTFGSPRLGDGAFASAAKAFYGGRLFRYVCGCDMVVKLPGQWGMEVFRHHCGERFITWNGRVMKEEEGCELLSAAEGYEARWAYPLNILKVAISIVQMDSSRVLRRIALMPIPGLADHFPADYQQAIEASLLPPAKPTTKRPVRKNGKRRANHNSEVLVTTR